MNVVFAYRNWEGQPRTVSVRGCPDPEKARLFLERVLETDVAMRVS